MVRQTQRGVDSLEGFLIEQGVNATSIHGDRSQQEREHALAMFRCGRCPVLVATDVAARGLDIPNVLHVINYDMPTNIDDYVHRIGRTGRAGNKGTAIAFVNEESKVLHELHDLMRETNQAYEPWFDDLVRSTHGGRLVHLSHVFGLLHGVCLHIYMVSELGSIWRLMSIHT